MKNRKVMIELLFSICLVLLLFTLVSFVRAQSDGTNDDDQVAIGDAIALITNDVVQVQGRLTDASGNPITQQVNVTVTIYDQPTGGTALCNDTDPVTPVNGLFTFAMDFCTAEDFSGNALYMGIKVGTDPEMTPRQEIFSVPYAWALRPGSIVKGADSYIFIPGSALVKNLNTDTTRWDIQANGAAQIYRGAAAGGYKTVYYPISLPAVLYGEPLTIKSVTVYYKCTNANSFIDYFDVNLQTSADSHVDVIDDDTNLTSTTATSYTVNPTVNNVLSANQGVLGLYMYLIFANDVDAIEIGGIRLQVGHQH